MAQRNAGCKADLTEATEASAKRLRSRRISRNPATRTVRRVTTIRWSGILCKRGVTDCVGHSPIGHIMTPERRAPAKRFSGVAQERRCPGERRVTMWGPDKVEALGTGVSHEGT